MIFNKVEEYIPTDVLLHCCCAPCSSAILEWMEQHDVKPVIFYCNPNIYPEEEYLIRKNEITHYAHEKGIRIIDDDYDHDAWLAYIRGLENEPERGNRCLMCFKYRLLRSAQKARELGLKHFTTTLASSRWKRLDQINEAGLWAAQQVNGPSEDELDASTECPPAVTFWDRNWRKGGLQERRNQLLHELGFYNQLYCGCEFSMRE